MSTDRKKLFQKSMSAKQQPNKKIIRVFSDKSVKRDDFETK